MRALADAPEAFGAGLEAERSLDEAAWRRRVVDEAWFLATTGGCPVGVVAATEESLHPGQRRLVAMWVDPAHRGGAVATALVEALCDWARALPVAAVSLRVTQANGRARRLYERLGFVPTGELEPMAGAPEARVERMQRRL
nr:GNAT family N-acetyltransferase [Motilibacter aurantiacus]